MPGSPPRVRGKAQDDLLTLLQAGITPACAGKRCTHGQPNPAHEDHPRVCGEKVGISGRLIFALGSPPRVRGKVALTQRTFTWFRITPACAGKSLQAYSSSSSSRDHPRVCGEKLPLFFGCDGIIGSPPRVRGKVCFQPEIKGAIRITPACAGKRRRRCCRENG